MIKIIKNNHITVVFLFFSLLSLFMIYKNIEIDNEYDKYLKTNYSYTIAKTTKFSGTGGRPYNIAYKYYVDGKKYESAIARDYNLKDPLRKFYKVKYSIEKPEISEINLNLQITDSQKIYKAGFKIYTPGYN
jgi:hypothetical protein